MQLVNHSMLSSLALSREQDKEAIFSQRVDTMLNLKFMGFLLNALLGILLRSMNRVDTSLYSSSTLNFGWAAASLNTVIWVQCGVSVAVKAPIILPIAPAP